MPVFKSLSISKTLVTFYEFFLSTLFLFTFILTIRDCSLVSNEVYTLMEMLAYPSTTTLCFVVVMLIFLHNLVSAYEDLSPCIKYCDGIVLHVNISRNLYRSFTLFINLISIIIPMIIALYFIHANNVVAVSLFLVSLDINFTNELLMYGVLYRIILTDEETKCASTVIHAKSESKKWFWEKTWNLMTKISLLGVGATLRHKTVADTFQLALLCAFIHPLALLFALPLYTRLLILLCGFPPAATNSSTSMGKFSRSTAASHIHIEPFSIDRNYVDIHSLSHKPMTPPNVFHYGNYVKLTIFIGLIIVDGHDIYRPRVLNDVHHQVSNVTYFHFGYSLVSTVMENPLCIPHLVYQLFKHINLNLLCLLSLGLLLLNRDEFRTSLRFSLMNLHVPKREHPQTDDHACVSRISTVGKKLNSNFVAAPTHNADKDDQHLEHPVECENDVLSLGLCVEKIKQGLGSELSDSDILKLLSTGQLKTRQLEEVIGDPNRAVLIRRCDFTKLLTNPHVLERLPFKNYNYKFVNGQCCEEVIGYIPIPVGKIGPLLLDGCSHYLPLATTEGCLVASTNRGCRALFLAGGVKSVVYRDQMTRSPVVCFSSAIEVVKCIAWIESSVGYEILKSAFEKTSCHINLLSILSNPVGNYLHIRFSARTGNAMGMNMVSKATDSALRELRKHFTNMQVISLSGNMCTDKKPAAINTILGRGKSVIAEARLPATVVAQVLHSTPSRLARLALAKNWTGSALAGSIGSMGSNAHAANLVAGIFAATGQDLAQVVGSSSCLTQFEVDIETDSLLVSVTMPCIEVGTIGGGTRLPAQRACLDLLGLNVDYPTEHLARIVAGAVLAGELSLMAALDTNDLVKAHLRLNRSSSPISLYQTSTTSSGLSTNLHVSMKTSVPTVAMSDASRNSGPSHYVM